MICVNNLNLEYGDRCIFSGADFNIKSGEISFIIGKNGSGKTTLANILCGLNFDYRGDVAINGERLSSKTNIGDIRKLVGMVFQNPDCQIVMNNVFDEMKSTMSNFMDRDISEAMVRKRLAMVGLGKYLRRSTYDLSGGEKQRLNIASTLVTNPKFAILDEATSMLDDDNRLKIYDLAVRLKRKGRGIVFTTNRISELFYADSVLIIHDRKVFKYSKMDILERPEILKKYGFQIPLSLLAEKKLRERKAVVNSWSDLVRGMEKI